MNRVIFFAAWACVAVGLVVNLVFFFSPGADDYPMLALSPAVIGVALLAVYIARRHNIEK